MWRLIDFYREKDRFFFVKCRKSSIHVSFSYLGFINHFFSFWFIGLHFNRAMALGNPNSAFMPASPASPGSMPSPLNNLGRKLPILEDEVIKESSSSTRTSTPTDSSPLPSQQEYKCPLCQEHLGSQKEFTQHIRAHNEVKPSPDPNDPTGQAKVYYCCLCRKMLSSFSSLDRHMLVHSGERPFNCERCGQTFTTNGNMHR